MNLADQRITVTGGAGFLGSYVLENLRARGCGRIFIPRQEEYDLTTAGGVERAFHDGRPQVLFHLAAVVGGIGANRDNPGKFFYENAIMGLQLIEGARRHGVAKTIVVGTICAYPKFAPVPFREDDLWNGYPEETNAPYGVAKKALLVQCQSYREQYGMNAIYLLPVNLYGPRDNFDPHTSHVIPALIRKFLEAKQSGAAEVTCWGDGSPTREFLYAPDAAEGLALAAERYDAPDPVNLGSGEEIRIDELANLVAQECGYQGRIAWDTTKPNGQPRRKLDTTRAWERFGFRARTSFLHGLRETIAWARQNLRI